MIHKEKDKENKREFTIMLCGLLYTVLDWLLSNFSAVFSNSNTSTIIATIFSNAIPSLFRAIVISLFFYIIQKINSVLKEIEFARGGFRSRELQDFMTDKNNEGLLADLTCEFIEQLEKSIKVDDGNLTVDHYDLAMPSYMNFWDLLIKEQQRNGKSKALHIKTIHSCNIGTWNTPTGKKLLAIQKDFVNKGGSIQRILCGHGILDNNIEVASIASKMIGLGIEVFYCDLDESSHNFGNYTFSWDFIYFKEQGITGIWECFQGVPGTDIEKTIFTSQKKYKGLEIAGLWDKIEGYSHKIES